MTDMVEVDVEGTTFFVQVDEYSPVRTAGLRDQALDFGSVRDTVRALASEFSKVWQEVQPSEATVSFGLNVTAKTGKLTGLLVEGGGEASLTVTLTWKDATP